MVAENIRPRQPSEQMMECAWERMVVVRTLDFGSVSPAITPEPFVSKAPASAI
jgi:hypothetical protein